MGVPSQQDVTQLLLAWSQGEATALEQLMPLVLQELRRLAGGLMAAERPGHSLQPTALVNEAYLRLVDCRRVNWQGRAHFFAIAARQMRRILVDSARARCYKKRGGGARRVPLDDVHLRVSAPSEDLLALDEALNALAEIDPRKVSVVELRFFGGLSVKETAAVLKVSEDTVFRDWRLAKVWLFRAINGHGKNEL